MNKGLMILAGILFLSNILFSQNEEKADSLLNIGKYQEALQMYNALLTGNSKRDGDILNDLYIKIGRSYMGFQSFDSAKIYFYKCRKYYEGEKTISNPKNYYLTYIYDADIAVELKDYPAALNNYLKILELKKKKDIEPPSDIISVKSYNGLAQIYLTFDYFDKAKENLMLAKKIAEQSGIKDSVSYIETIGLLSCYIYKIRYGGKNNDYRIQAEKYYKRYLNDTEEINITVLENYWTYLKLMNLHQDMNSAADKLIDYYVDYYGKNYHLYAKPLLNRAYYHSHFIVNDSIVLAIYKQVKAIREENLGKKHPLYADACYLLGKQYNLLKRKDDAYKLQVEALEIREDYYGKDHPLYAKSLLRLAVHAKHNNDIQLQETYLNNIQLIYENNYGKEHPDYIIICYNLIRLYKDNGRIKEAEKLHSQAVNLKMRLYGKSSRRYYSALKSQANFYSSYKNYNKAAKVYEQLLEEVEKNQGKEDSEYSSALETIIRLYINNDEYEKAEKSYNELVLIQKSAFGTEDNRYISTLKRQSDFYRNNNDYQKALIGYIEIAELKEKMKGKESKSYEYALVDLAVIYYKLKNYKQALNLFIKARSLEYNLSGNKTNKYRTLTTDIARSYEKIGNFMKAEAHYLEATDRSKEKYGDSSYKYSVDAKNLGLYYTKRGEFIKAEQLYLLAKDIREKEKGKDHSSYILMCRRLGDLYGISGKFKEAENYFKEAKSLRSKKYGSDHPKKIEIDMKLVSLYFRSAQYKKSLSYTDTCENFYKRDINKNYKEYINCLNYKGRIHNQTGNYKKAEYFYKRTKELAFKKYGKENSFYLTSLNNRGLLYQEMGYYKEAEDLLTEVILISEKLYGDSTEKLSNFYNNLAILYKVQDRVTEAESYLLKSISIIKKIYGVDHPKYAVIIGNMATMYSGFGNKEKALKLYIESKDIFEKYYGKNHPYYMTACNSLGNLYFYIENYEKAEQYYEEALLSCEHVFGKDHVNYAKYTAGMGNLFSELKQYEKAEEYLLFAKNKTGELLGKDHISYASRCESLGDLYRYTGKYMKAVSNYNMAKRIYEINFGKTHYDYYSNLFNIAELQRDMGNNTSVERYYLEANILLNKYIDRSDRFMSEKEREIFIRSKVKYRSDRFHSFYLINRREDPKLPGVVYNNSIRIKGHLLKSSVSVKKAIMHSNDTILINTYKKINEYGDLLTSQFALPLKRRRDDLEQIEEKVNSLEKKLTKMATKNPVVKKIAFKNVKWQDIRDKLKDDEAAVEFIQFNYHKKDVHTKIVLYYALVLRKDFEYPKAVYMTYESFLADILNIGHAKNEYQYIKELYDIKSKTADSLYRVSFHHIEKYLKGCKTVYISPTGLLNKVAFDALPCDSVNILSDKYNIVYMTGTSNIISETGYYSNNIENMSLFGGLDYDMNENEMKKMSDLVRGNSEKNPKVEITNSNLSFDSLSRGISWSYLPGTKLETEEIKSIFDKRGIKTVLYSGNQGNEEQFKELDGNSPTIIHLSTHGYYFPEQLNAIPTNDNEDDVRFITSENPLIRSGLLLSGGNIIFSGKKLPEGTEDGVLSAQEISNINMFNTKLTVLSACQTGLGDVKGSEGVYGLQRAFKMAGVDYLIISLWEVPDVQTKELMVKFYENWLKGSEIRKAFKDAQEYLKEKYKNIEGAAYAWAAFILIR